eukprot:TRINITY_DN10779_c0_g1_i2.p1 TRINITY_DN10779_c0_g1~~TRINITY_DN10779_c0_g1_i2.p1  ORF type:complete len:321 (-),score=79.74 TRINITY_DN10779_c0_g1_i2:3-965(-)
MEKRVFVDKFVMCYFRFVERFEVLCGIGVKAWVSCPVGGTILNQSGSIQYLLECVYPEHSKTKHNFKGDFCLKDRIFIDQFICTFCNFVEKEKDLCNITTWSFNQNPRGLSVLYLNNYSPQTVFQEAYPEFFLDQRKVQQGFWNNTRENYLVHRLLKEYHLRKNADWYRLSMGQVVSIFGRGTSMKNLIKLLDCWHPEEDWNYNKFSEKIQKRAKQRFLGLKLREMIQDEIIIEEYTIVRGSHKFVFDFYFPGLKMVVEYQGEQHYFSITKWMSFEQQLERDKEKNRVCQEEGLTLINIPYWWDNTTHSLKDLIKNQSKP